MNIELNHYGLCVDSDWFYIAIDWKLIAISAVLFVGYKIWRKSQKVF